MTAASPSLRDVAERAGVSRSLVSLALRGERGVADSRRRAVVDAADALNYPVTLLARAMSSGSELVIGVVATDLSNPFHAEVCAGVARAARENGMSVVTFDGLGDRDWVERQLRIALRMELLGVVVVSTWLGNDVLSTATATRPIVVVGTAVSGVPGVDSVGSDEASGLRDAVLHLAAQGHRRLGFVAESTRASSTRRHRMCTDVARTLFGEGAVPSVTIDASETDILAFLEARTGIIAATDVAARRILDIATRNGLQVPSDVAIVGFDNTATATSGRIHLTTIDQSRASLGSRAAELLVERLRGRTRDRDDLLPTVLVTRESTTGSGGLDGHH